MSFGCVAMAPPGASDVQITCTFVTRLPERFRVASAPLAVPGKLTRYGLSEVINHLLALAKPTPFDFLVDGELVRTSLEKLCLRKGISAESVLEVEYVPAVAPPAPEHAAPHDDWVAAVDGGWAPAIATGCYDGTARLLVDGARAALTVPRAAGGREGDPDAQPVVAVALLPPSSDAADAGAAHRAVLAAGGHDGVVRAWDVRLGNVQKGGNKKNKNAAEADGARAYVGHKGAIRSIAGAPGGAFFASASDDHTARVWRREGGAAMDGDDGDGPATDGVSRNVAGKRRKKTAEGDAARDSAQRRSLVDELNDPTEPEGWMAPIGEELVLTGHRDRVSSAAWESAASVWTGSFDKTLKCWDVAEGGGDARRAQSFDAPKAIASVAVRPGGGRVAWCGGGDKAVHAWDPRVGQTTGAMTTWTSHEVRRETRAKKTVPSFFSPRRRERGFPSFFPERKKRPEGRREPSEARERAPRSSRHSPRSRPKGRDVGDERYSFPDASPLARGGGGGNKSLIFSRDVSPFETNANANDARPDSTRRGVASPAH